MTILCTVVICLALGLSYDTRGGEVCVGDSRAEVVEALGEPLGESSSGNSTSLIYRCGWVDLKGGNVVSVHLSKPSSGTGRNTTQRPEIDKNRRNGHSAHTPESGRTNHAVEKVSETVSAEQSINRIAELTTARVEEEVKRLLRQEHEIMGLDIVSMKRSETSVVCTFKARVVPHSRISDENAHYGAVSGTLTLMPRGDDLVFDGRYRSVSGDRLDQVLSGTIKGGMTKP